ncbi:MAG: hypothetical protein PF693_17060 [Spirochaetia bacterium]|jgi:hypothetical protein|nr:hypothetical protein [Spirochaetia bacterium]
MVHEEFNKLIITNGERLFSLCHFVLNHNSKDIILNRKFLGRLNIEATWMQETLDSYGSKNNSTWFPFREAIAALKLFSSISYDVVHLKKAAPYYKLLSIKGEFVIELDKILDSFYLAIFSISGFLLKFLKKQKININLKPIDPGFFHEIQLDFQLDMTKSIREIQEQEQTLVYLATSFMNLGSDTEILECVKKLKKKDYSDCIPEIVSEEKLRLVKAQFHNLQSMYDTHLSKTFIESSNSNLYVLRGHISIIFHLLSSATNLAHYYERHMMTTKFSFSTDLILPMSRKKLLSILVEFFLHFTTLYFTAARSLCQSIISEYAEDGDISVGIPNYRGFHVRPSTLISKIILHYGTEVKMKLGSAEYDASSPLNLFRANEKINAEKRKYISRHINSDSLFRDFNPDDVSSWPKMLQLVILDLMDKEEIILYEKNLSLEGNVPEVGESPEEFFKRIITLFLASGKIDIKSNLNVTFFGDKRVLNDLRILAEDGYGEDKYGNNIMLPPELAYLKR